MCFGESWLTLAWGPQFTTYLKKYNEILKISSENKLPKFICNFYRAIVDGNEF